MLLNYDMNKSEGESFETQQDVKHFCVLEFYFISVLVGSERRRPVTHKGLDHPRPHKARPTSNLGFDARFSLKTPTNIS
jgi:hypothetical protein